MLKQGLIVLALGLGVIGGSAVISTVGSDSSQGTCSAVKQVKANGSCCPHGPEVKTVAASGCAISPTGAVVSCASEACGGKSCGSGGKTSAVQVSLVKGETCPAACGEKACGDTSACSETAVSDCANSCDSACEKECTAKESCATACSGETACVKAECDKSGCAKEACSAQEACDSQEACPVQTEVKSCCDSCKSEQVAADVSAGCPLTAYLVSLQSDAGKEKTKILCPVAGGEVKKEFSSDYRGGKVYFCCGDCREAFKKETDKYAAKANLQLVLTRQYVQKACPLTGRPIAEDQKAVVNGVTVNFCCGGCNGKVQAMAEAERIKALFGNEAFEKGFEPRKKNQQS